MKSLNQYIQEKLIINKDYVDAHVNMLTPKSFDELKDIIEDRYDKLGPGTEQKPIDFNDIDVSNIDSFYKKHKGGFVNGGLFYRTKFKYIDISYWDVSNVKSMFNMFSECEELRSVGDISYWDVSSVTNMSCMFYGCKELKSVGDISNWDVSNVTDMSSMFTECKELESIGDISGWDVSSVTDMTCMFDRCKSFNQDISKWNVYNVKHHLYAFDKCSIKEEYKPKFK